MDHAGALDHHLAEPALDIGDWSRPSPPGSSAPDNAFEHAPVALATCDAQSGLHLSANARYRVLLGYPLDELRELSHFQLTHRDDREAEQRALHALRSGGTDLYERCKRMISRTGETMHVNARVSALDSEVPVTAMAVALIEDEYEVGAQRRRLVSLGCRSELLDGTPVGIAEIEPGTLKLIEADPGLAALLGRPDRLLAGHPLRSVLDPVSCDQVASEAGRLVRGEIEAGRLTLRLIPQHGDERWIELRLRLVPATGDAGACLLATVIDISAAKRAERAERSLAMVRLAMAALSPTGLIEVAVASGRIVSANPAFCRLLGYPADASGLLGIAYRDIVSPEAPGRSAGAVDFPSEDMRATRRYLRRDGGIVAARIASTALPAADGQLDTQLISAIEAGATADAAPQPERRDDRLGD